MVCQDASGIDLDCLAEPAKKKAGKVADFERPGLAGESDLCPAVREMEEREARLLLGGVTVIP
jgi:hypothetical protein